VAISTSVEPVGGERKHAEEENGREGVAAASEDVGLGGIDGAEDMQDVAQLVRWFCDD